MKIYFYANSIYQLSHALPLYEKLKTTFVVNNFKTNIEFLLLLVSECAVDKVASLVENISETKLEKF